LNALERLPPTGAHLIALPMKIRGGSGGPLRAIAILPMTR
jgi:kynurenine formamidase